MSKALRLLGLTDVDKVRQQIDEAVDPIRSIIGREAYSISRYAEQFREMYSGQGIARRAMEDFKQYQQSFTPSVRDMARVDLSSQLADLERISSLSTSNAALKQITDQARRLTQDHGDLARLTSSQSAFEKVLDQARDLVVGSSLQRMLEEEAKRLQHAMTPVPDFWALESVVPQLQERLTRDRRQLESLISQVAGPTGLSFENEATRLHEEITRRASELPQFEPFIQDALRAAEQFRVDSWSPATIRNVLDSVRWDDLISAAQTHLKRTESKQSTKSRRGKSGRREPTRTDLALIIAALSLIIGIIETLFESGLIQRFDAREPPATPLATTQPRVESWAIATLPTMLFADPSLQGARLFRVPAGAWLRVLEHRPQWLLVEVETGEHSRLQGWMLTLATRDLQEDVWQHGLEALAFSTGTSVSTAILELPNPPEVVRNAGEDARAAFAATLASLKSRNTRVAYERAFTRFFEFCLSAGIALPELTAIDVIAYVTGVSQQDSAATAKQHLIALRKLFDYFQAADVVAVNPTAGLRSPKPSPRPAVSVEGEEVERLLQSLAGTKEAELRDRAIVTLIAGLGLKVSQLTALTLGAVEETGDGKLQLRLGPRRQPVHVPAVASEALEAYVSLRRVASPPEAPLFVSTRTGTEEADGARALARGEIYAMLKRRAKACGIPTLSCEGLRHALR